MMRIALRRRCSTHAPVPPGSPWTHDELNRLRLAARQHAADGKSVDWYQLARDQFPGRTALELSFEHEMTLSQHQSPTNEGSLTLIDTVRNMPHARSPDQRQQQQGSGHGRPPPHDKQAVRERLRTAMEMYDTRPDKSALVPLYVGHGMGWSACMALWRRMRLTHQWTDTERNSLLRQYLTHARPFAHQFVQPLGLTALKCHAELDRMLLRTRPNVRSVAKLATTSTTSTTTPPDDQHVHIPAARALLRRQFQVAGPVWRTLVQTVGSDLVAPSICKTLVMDSPSFWFDVHSRTAALPHTVRHSRRWTSAEVAKLKELVAQQLASMKPTADFQRLDWLAISTELGRKPRACKVFHSSLYRAGHDAERVGLFGPEEDADLLSNWKRHKFQLDQYQLSAPRRRPAVASRLRYLLGKIINNHSSVANLVSSLDLSASEVLKQTQQDPAFRRSLKLPAPS